VDFHTEVTKNRAHFWLQALGGQFWQ